jgi:hypothetical protein
LPTISTAGLNIHSVAHNIILYSEGIDDVIIILQVAGKFIGPPSCY